MISTTSTNSTKKKKRKTKKTCKCSEEENILHKLDAKAICDIIGICSKSGVKELSFGELHVSFHDSKPESKITSVETEDFIEPTEIGDHSASPAEKEILEDFEETQQIISQPEAFEERIIDSFINGNGINEEADN